MKISESGPVGNLIKLLENKGILVDAVRELGFRRTSITKNMVLTCREYGISMHIMLERAMFFEIMIITGDGPLRKTAVGEEKRDFSKGCLENNRFKHCLSCHYIHSRIT